MIPSTTLDGRMKSHSMMVAQSFKKVIESKAEEMAEVFVSSEIGLQDEEGRKEGYKQNYIVQFIEDIKEIL